jgi:hypothetical protein
LWNEVIWPLHLGGEINNHVVLLENWVVVGLLNHWEGTHSLAVDAFIWKAVSH